MSGIAGAVRGRERPPRLPFRRAAVIAVALTLLIPLSAGLARAQIGERDFYDPIITEDPNPSNELDITPLWYRTRSGPQFSLQYSLEKQLSKNFSLMLASAWNYLRPRAGEPVNGFDNLEVLPKYAFFTSVAHELRLAAGVDSVNPTGNVDAGASGHANLGPLLMLAKGMGDLPVRGFGKYLRPFAVQADTGYLFEMGGARMGNVQFNAALSYSFSYLRRSAPDLPIDWRVGGLVPFIEFNYDQNTSGRINQTGADLRLMPGLAYVYGPFQFTVATQVPLDHDAKDNDLASVLGLVDVQLAELWPGFGRTLF